MNVPVSVPNVRVTVDELAGMVQRGFVDLKTTLVDKIDKIDYKIDDRVDGLRLAMDQRFEEQDRKYDLRFNRLDNNIQVIMRHLGIPEGQAAI